MGISYADVATVDHHEIERQPEYLPEFYEQSKACADHFDIEDEAVGYHRELLLGINAKIKEKLGKRHSLTTLGDEINVLPERVVIIDGTSVGLPFGRQMERSINYYLEKWLGAGHGINIQRVHTREDWQKAVEGIEDKTLLVELATSRNIFNKEDHKRLKESGCVIVPGSISVGGEILSDKQKTFNYLSNNGTDLRLVAKYEAVKHAEDKKELAGGIINAVDELNKDGIERFFIKPAAGGGGKGGFRLIKIRDMYLVFDLSRLTGKLEEPVLPYYFPIASDQDDVIDSFVWVFAFFVKNKLDKQYIETPIEDLMKKYNAETKRDALKALVKDKNERPLSEIYTPEFLERFNKKLLTRSETIELLANAIEAYPYDYAPVVCEHLTYGPFGLRAHYRVNINGIKPETIYARIFQTQLSENGIGYIGLDNLSNAITGDIEEVRASPMHHELIKGVGGFEALEKTLINGAEAASKILDAMPEDEKGIYPVRLEFDMTALEHKLHEGNGNSSRDLALNNSWGNFVENNAYWFFAALACYQHEKKKQ
ncbi:MAG: hypothetical protein J4432_04620 [DPANN group archaeon]|nr:hypothetical protein [DPANN group archaeon]